MLLCTACLVALGLTVHRPSLLLVEILTIGAGIGWGTSFPISTISVQNAVDRAHLGVATGLMTFMRSLGGAMGVAAFGVIFLAGAGCIFVSFLFFVMMPEKPLQGAAEPALME
jgi:hypothetical protein